MIPRHPSGPRPSAAAWLGLIAATGSVAAARRLLRRQAAAARLAIGKPLGEEAHLADRTYKKKYGRPLELLLLGDSIAAGLGAEHPKDTLGAQLAKRLAKAARRSVRLTTVAQVGAESSMLPDQLARRPGHRATDVAVIVIGGNDVTHRVKVTTSVEHLVRAVETLRSEGSEVVVGTCPDLGALRPVPQPLRVIGSRASRQLADAQRRAVIRAGGYAVDLAAVVGPFFIAQPDQMFALDHFHPSAAGYKRTAKALLPSVLAALGQEEQLPFGHHLPVLARPTVPERGDASNAQVPIFEPPA